MALKILVVDDATFTRDLVKKQLRDHLPGVEIFEAPDGVRALVVMKHNPIDIILSDWEMPLMTGEDLLRQVRATPEGASTPFVMITSRGDRDHVVKAVQAGVSDYITKPFSAEELLRKVHKQLKVIGKLPTLGRGAATQGIANASVDVLTGGAKPKAGSQGVAHASIGVLTGGAPKPSTPSGSASALLGGAPTAAKAPSPKPTAKAQAQLRFSDNRVFSCVIREMSLQAMSCVLQRANDLPTVFDQAVVDIDMGDKGLARVNGYVHSITAGESRPDSNIVKLMIRFVDNDVDKFEVLSKFIEQM